MTNTASKDSGAIYMELQSKGFFQNYEYFNKIKEVYQLRLKLERSAKTYVELAQLQYINGVINYMDVLDAQRGYFDAQIGVSNAIRDELIAVVNVYKALGGGWQVEK